MDVNEPTPAPSLLIVEDDYEASEIIRAMTARTFPQIEIRVAENGQKGLEICREHHPSIVVTDINMPKVDGISMAAALKEMHADAKLIVVSGYGDKIEEFRELGAEEYIQKPIQFKRLFAAIARCLEDIRRERQG